MPRLIVVTLVALVSVTAPSACGRASDQDEPASSSRIVPFPGVDDQPVTATRPEWPVPRPVSAREARRELRRVGAQARRAGNKTGDYSANLEDLGIAPVPRAARLEASGESGFTLIAVADDGTRFRLRYGPQYRPDGIRRSCGPRGPSCSRGRW